MVARYMFNVIKIEFKLPYSYVVYTRTYATTKPKIFFLKSPITAS